MTFLDKAIKDGFAYITGEDTKRKITYVISDNHTEYYNDPEEQVRAEFWAELIYKYEYPANRIKIEVVIPDRLPTDRADIKCVFDNRITVSLGSVNDLEYKMNFAKEIIETKIGDKTEGTLTILSDANSASFLDKESLENNAKVYNDNIASTTTADTQETDENGNPIETETSETTSAAVAME